MHLRSGRRLVTPPPTTGDGAHRSRPLRRRTTEGAGGGDGVDRLSGLPEELLLEVLARLGCKREAARTSLLARRWRRLWSRLPGEWTITVAAADPAQGARAKLHRSARNHLTISAPGDWSRRLAAPRLTSLLRIAAGAEPAEVHVPKLHVEDGGGAFELPCFHRAASIELNVYYELNFTLPPAAGVFAALETLVLLHCVADVGGLLARCPRLRYLKLIGSWTVRTLAIRSASLEELVLGIHEKPDGKLRHVDIVAPVLKKFTRQSCGRDEFTVSYAMPAVEEVSMFYTDSTNVGFGHRWRLDTLTMGTAYIDKHDEKPVRVLSLMILADRRFYYAKRSFAQEIAGLPGVMDFSALELKLHAHVFGAFVLKLLQIRPIQTLKVVLYQGLEPKCSEYCDCDRVSNWRNQRISLTHLEVAIIEGFCCAYHEMDFLKLLLRSAPMLKRMTVQLSVEASVNKRRCQDLRTIFEANTYVKCNVYRKCGKEISFA